MYLVVTLKEGITSQQEWEGYRNELYPWASEHLAISCQVDNTWCVQAYDMAEETLQALHTLESNLCNCPAVQQVERKTGEPPGAFRGPFVLPVIENNASS